MKILNPVNIFNDFKSGKIDSSTAIEKLLVKLQKTDDHTKKIQYIDIFSEIYRDFKPDNDEFEHKLINLLKNAIRNENYLYVLYYIVDAVKQIGKSFESLVMNEVIKKYVLFYDVVPEEARFIVDLDYLDPTYDYTHKKIQFADRYKNKIVAHSETEFYDRYFLIKQNHIIGVKLKKKINSIPDSIQALKRLKYLHILVRKKKFTIPQSLELLTQIKVLRIYSGFPLKIPEKLKERVQKHYIQKYLQDGVCMDDALLLANLEFIDWSLKNLEKNHMYEEDPEWYNLGDVDVWHYRLDEMGHVIEIYIKPFEGHSSLGFFHIEFCYFKQLEVLDLQFYKLESIPEAITNLKNLKKLRIVNFGDITTKIPISVKSFIESLESFYFDGKFIYW